MQDDGHMKHGRMKHERLRIGPRAWLAMLAMLAMLATLVAHATASGAGLPDYIRYAEDRRSARLEVAIRTLTLPSGQTVDLIGVVHIADRPYYQALNERFAGYDAVLFELVGDPRALTASAPPALEQEAAPRPGESAIGFVQQAAGKYLDLTFQLGAIDYTRKNMVHADLGREEFARMQQERGETTLTLFTRAMEAQLSGQVNTAAMTEFDTWGLIRILLARDSAAEFKKSLARTFDQMEAMTALMEGKNGSVILSGRNEVALRKLREVLEDRRKRRVAVFYGGAHMPGIEAALVRDLKAVPSGEEWLAAWTMPKP
jgi:hypothetical protein